MDSNVASPHAERPAAPNHPSTATPAADRPGSNEEHTSSIENQTKRNGPTPDSRTLVTFPDPYIVGSTYSSRDDALDALLHYTVSRGLSYSLRSNDSRRIIAVCRDKNCPFRLRMKVKPNQVTTSISHPHNCPPEVHYRWKSASSVRYLRLNHQALCGQDPNLTPKQLQALERSRGNIISYSQAWRAIAAAKRDAAGDNMELESPNEESVEDREPN